LLCHKVVPDTDIYRNALSDSMQIRRRGAWWYYRGQKSATRYCYTKRI